MGRDGFNLVRIGGIQIKAHWSWLIIVVLLALSLSAGFFPANAPGESTTVYLLLGVVGSLALFGSVLVHELAHALLARRRGLRVRDITLFIFGGAASLEDEPEKAGDEFAIAAIGPITSLAIAGVFYGLQLIASPPVREPGAGLAATFKFLAQMNAILALFNMIPGFPLDGGRVLRSIVWGVSRNVEFATRFAGQIGQLVAYGFIAFGIFRIFFLDDFGGLWLAFIGWYLLTANQQSVASTIVRQRLRGITVAQVMKPSPLAAAPHMTMAHILTQFILPNNMRALPVVEGERLVGIVTLSDIRDIPQEEWGTVTVRDVMTGSDKLMVVRPQDGLDRAMELLGEADVDQLPVADPSGRLVGLLTRADLLRWMQIREELKVKSGDIRA